MSDRRRTFRKKPQKNNQTGVSGVSLTFVRSGTNPDLRYPCYDVAYSTVEMVEGEIVTTRHSKRFYLSHYDADELALEAAAEFKVEMDRQVQEELKRLGSEFTIRE